VFPPGLGALSPVQLDAAGMHSLHQIKLRAVAESPRVFKASVHFDFIRIARGGAGWIVLCSDPTEQLEAMAFSREFVHRVEMAQFMLQELPPDPQFVSVGLRWSNSAQSFVFHEIDIAEL
jgi:hypothetical protein